MTAQPPLAIKCEPVPDSTAEALAKVGEGVRGKQVSSPTLEKGQGGI